MPWVLRKTTHRQMWKRTANGGEELAPTTMTIWMAAGAYFGTTPHEVDCIVTLKANEVRAANYATRWRSEIDAIAAALIWPGWEVAWEYLPIEIP